MPILLWLLGLPISLIIILMVLGAGSPGFLVAESCDE